MRILRVVSSLTLPCGCFVGRYETYAGTTVSVIDERPERCPHPSHRVGSVLRDTRAAAAGIRQATTEPTLSCGAGSAD